MHLFRSFIVTYSYFSVLFLVYLSSYYYCVQSFFSVLHSYLVFLSQQIVLENFRPELTDHIQLHSYRSVQHRLDNPSWADPLSISFRPAQVVLCCNHWGTLLTHCYLLIFPPIDKGLHDHQGWLFVCWKALSWVTYLVGLICMTT